MKKPVAFIWLSLTVVGCMAHRPNYVEQVQMIPFPATAEGRRDLCFNLRQDVARQETGAAMAVSSMYALAFQAMARNNIAALQEKMAEVGCDVQAAPPAAVKSDAQIRACMKTCADTTHGDDMSCFKACAD